MRRRYDEAPPELREAFKEFSEALRKELGIRMPVEVLELRAVQFLNDEKKFARVAKAFERLQRAERSPEDLVMVLQEELAELEARQAKRPTAKRAMKLHKMQEELIKIKKYLGLSDA